MVFFGYGLPILGINEIPSNNTIIGGFLIFMSIIYYSLVIKTNRRFIGLKLKLNMERPDFFSLKNGSKSKLPFSNQRIRKKIK